MNLSSIKRRTSAVAAWTDCLLLWQATALLLVSACFHSDGNGVIDSSIKNVVHCLGQWLHRFCFYHALQCSRFPSFDFLTFDFKFLNSQNVHDLIILIIMVCNRLRLISGSRRIRNPLAYFEIKNASKLYIRSITRNLIFLYMWVWVFSQENYSIDFTMFMKNCRRFYDREDIWNHWDLILESRRNQFCFHRTRILHIWILHFYIRILYLYLCKRANTWVTLPMGLSKKCYGLFFDWNSSLICQNGKRVCRKTIMQQSLSAHKLKINPVLQWMELRLK